MATSPPPLPARPRLEARRVEFTYQKVQLRRNDFLGHGSYGIVCKALVDELVCAAKIIHQTFFQITDLDPNSTKMMSQFERECDFLSAIRHPCIVQYLGTYQEPDSRLPVLLMELMDESLTKFLENSLKADMPMPYHNQLSISHDITMALSFLHSNGIIHRDLSSNNVLLLAGTRAKVADFGMSKLVEVNTRMTPLTQCPGTLVYMPPEALRIVPKYSEKLDVFATGVLIIQIITCKFPNPSIAKRSVQDERIGIMEIPVPERERRQKDIELVDSQHPLLSIALDCLHDKEQARPTSSEVCQHLAALKEQDGYTESVQEGSELPLLVKRFRDEISTKEEECATLREKVDRVTSTIDSLHELYEKEKQALVDKETKALKEELERVREEVRQLKEEREGRSLEPLPPSLSRLSMGSYLKSMPHATNMFEDRDQFHSLAGSGQVGLQKSIDLEAKLNLEAPDPLLWYHGPVSREVACERLIKVGKPGSYLIRKSDNQHVLSFLDREERCHHFRIIEQNGRFNIGGSVWFSCLSNLVGFHSKYSSVVEKHSERLDVPVAPPTPVSLPPSVRLAPQ